MQSSSDEETGPTQEEIEWLQKREEEKKQLAEDKKRKCILKHSDVRVRTLMLCSGKELEDAKMTKEQKAKRDLEEIDKLFAEMGIEVPQGEQKQPQESKKSKKKKKKDRKDKQADNAEEAKQEQPAEDVKQEQPAAETKQEQPAAEAKQEQPEELKQAPAAEPSQPETPIDKEAAIREALNKRFKAQNKKQHADDAAMLAKKEALVS